MPKESQPGTGEFEPVTFVGWTCGACDYKSPFTVYGTRNGMFAEMLVHVWNHQQEGVSIHGHVINLQFRRKGEEGSFERIDVEFDQFAEIVRGHQE